MLVSGVIDQVAKRLDLDEDDYYPVVMISYINAAIQRIHNGLVKINDPLTRKSITITGVTSKPSDFFKTIPLNGYPIIETDTTLDLQPGAPETVTIKYSTFKPLLTTVADLIPLPDYCISEIVDYVCIHVNNDFEADVTQDTTLATSDESVLFSAKGG